MGGQSKSQIVGYKYSLYAHFIFGAGVADFVSKIWFRDSDTIAWQGKQDVNGIIAINKPDLFGGQSSQGGVVGNIAFMNGAVGQAANTYQVGFRGALTPAYRGVMGIIWQDLNIGMNPYLPTWGVEWSRIHKRISLDGVTDREQWYDEKAAIPFIGSTDPLGLFTYGDICKYLVISDTDDKNYSTVSTDTWSTGIQPIANAPAPSNLVVAVGTQASSDEHVAFWIRKTITLPNLNPVKIEVRHDNNAKIYINGNLQEIVGVSDWLGYVYLSPTTKILDIAAYVLNIYLGTGNIKNPCFIGISVEKSQNIDDINPIHWLREFKTEPWSSARIDESKLPDDVWKAAADTVYGEGLGVTFFYDGSQSIEAAMSEVCRHIGAETYNDRRTGEFKIKLIRNDYNIATIPSFNESNIIDMSKDDTPIFGQLTTDVVVNYTDTANAFVEASITVQDIALAQQQGKRITANLDYKGFTSGEVAGRKAQQMLNTLSKPLQKRSFVVRMSAGKGLNKGDVFKFSWERENIVDMVMRITDMNFGNGISNRIKIDAVQDEFAMPTTSFIAPPTSDWTAPFSEPTALNDRLIIEAPYLELVQLQGQTAVDAQLKDSPDSAFVLSAAGTQTNTVKAMMYDGVSGYEQVGILEFCPTATLNQNIGYLDETFNITGGKILDQVTLGTWCQIDNELFRVDAISGTSATMGRGCLDTIPALHATGAKIYFWDNASLTDSTEFVSGNNVNVKLLTVNPKNQLAIADAPVDTVTMVGRAARPYPPANVKIATAYYPPTVSGEFSVTLANRNRIQQTSATIYDWLDGTITPAVNTRYNLLFNDHTGTLLVRKDNIDPLSSISVSLGVTDNITMELWTVDDLGESMMKFTHTFAYTPASGVTTNTITATTYTHVDNTTIIDGGQI